MISIFSLIYRSTMYADSVWTSVNEATPEIGSGTAEFFFVANNPTPEVAEHLARSGYRHHVREAPIMDDAARAERGIAGPRYLSDVYCGWNAAIGLASGDVLVPVNSDHVFAPGWLGALSESWHDGLALSPLMLEPGRNGSHFGEHISGTGSVVADCGFSPDDFDAAEFSQAAEEHARDAFTPGGVYMPCMFSAHKAREAGLYPPGNLEHPRRRAGLPADRVFFARLADVGVEHRTCWRSIVYHFQEGEMQE